MDYIEYRKRNKREIKFRAWDEDNKRMIKADELYFDEILPLVAILNAPKSNLMQYIGLNDRNKKEIYDGDIVKCEDINSGAEFIAVVEFGNPNGEYNWGYQLKHIRGDKPSMDILLWVDMEETGAYIEVIGNIYENPEMMME